MKQTLTSFRILSAIALLALAVGCASTQSKENSLVAAGFTVVVPKTAAQQQKTQGPPAGQSDHGSEEREDLLRFPGIRRTARRTWGGPKTV